MEPRRTQPCKCTHAHASYMPLYSSTTLLWNWPKMNNSFCGSELRRWREIKTWILFSILARMMNDLCSSPYAPRFYPTNDEKKWTEWINSVVNALKKIFCWDIIFSCRFDLSIVVRRSSQSNFCSVFVEIFGFSSHVHYYPHLPRSPRWQIVC